jgi:hypothetical protein
MKVHEAVKVHLTERAGDRKINSCEHIRIKGYQIQTIKMSSRTSRCGLPKINVGRSFIVKAS